MPEHPFEFAERAERLSSGLNLPESKWSKAEDVGEPSAALKRYVAGEDALCDIPTDGLFLHGASVSIAGRATVFLGHSTAGKSTLAHLLASRFPVIADDAVYIRRNGECSWAVRNGRHRTGVGLKLERGDVSGHQPEWPLRAFVRIYKGESPRLAPITQKRLCRHLMDAVYEIDVQRKFSGTQAAEMWFRLAAALTRQIKGWHLHFPPTADTVRLIAERFGR